MNAVFAAAPSSEVLRLQRSRIDQAISARNALLERIHFAGHNDDSVQLASINGSELTVRYALEALEGVLAVCFLDTPAETSDNLFSPTARVRHCRTIVAFGWAHDFPMKGPLRFGKRHYCCPWRSSGSTQEVGGLPGDARSL